MTPRRKLLLGLAVAALLLWLVFRGVDGRALLAAIGRADPLWLLLSLVPTLGSYVTRIGRWRYIVRSSRPATSFRHMFSATQIGFLANYSLPLRVGEVIRAAALGRLARVPVSEALAMVALDRVADVIGLILLLLVTTLTFPAREVVLPAGAFANAEALTISSAVIRTASFGATLFLVAVVGVLVTLHLRRDLALRLTHGSLAWLSGRLADRVRAMLDGFADGLLVFGSRAEMLKSMGFNLVTWMLYLAQTYAVLRAFGLASPWYVTAVCLSTLAVAQSAPGAPGFVGQYHFGVVAGLMLAVPGVAPVTAKAAAIVSHLCVVVPVAVVGVGCLLREQLGLLELRREAARSPGGDPPPR